MSNLGYIESYFKGELLPDERRQFEQRITDDAAFAEEVAFYCSAIAATKDQLVEGRKKQFRELYNNNKDKRKKTAPSLVRKLWPYITAAAVVTGIIITLNIFSNPSPQQMADTYIRKNFEVPMGVTMDTREDSLNKAINLYNENELPAALRLFENLIQKDSTALHAKKMAGIVSLRLQLYDKAIDYFTQLERLTLFSNPGKFYHALTLIKRNQPGDREKAKQLLNEVVDMNLEGKETARTWLKSL
jgi:tetratricopeptide (TPR) repeat protein